MEKLAVFGASGKTGKVFVPEALRRGYALNALVRNPSRVQDTSAAMHLIKGDIQNPEDVELCLEGTTAVVSLVGHVKACPPDLQEQFMHSLLPAMQKRGINRLITLTGAGVPDPVKDGRNLVNDLLSYVMTHFAGKAFHHRMVDGIRHVDCIRRYDDLDWTVVRAPILTRQKGRGYVRSGQLGSVRGYSLRREDLVRFMLDELEEPQWIRGMPYLSS
ncbi:MAG: hypothetical protein CSA96_10595 [Bacteroidetes bacterium]|nr:MAG: hypothetical protein CSA96_10595 [Bacteroidota bacterium]